MVFRKLLGWRLEKSKTRKYTCHLGHHRRKHEWKRELGSEHTQGTKVGQLSRSFQTNQPILSPSRERTGRPAVDDTRTVQEGRKTSRSQDIDANSSHEEPFLRKERRDPLLKRVIQARSSEDNKDPNVETAHERKRRLVVETNTENVPDSSHDDSSHEQTKLNEVNMDFQIPGLPHSVVKHAEN